METFDAELHLALWWNLDVSIPLSLESSTGMNLDGTLLSNKEQE
jgi:hypothetical protein